MAWRPMGDALFVKRLDEFSRGGIVLPENYNPIHLWGEVVAKGQGSVSQLDGTPYNSDIPVGAHVLFRAGEKIDLPTRDKKLVLGEGEGLLCISPNSVVAVDDEPDEDPVFVGEGHIEEGAKIIPITHKSKSRKDSSYV